MKKIKNQKGIGLVTFIIIFVAILVIAGIVVGIVIINKNLNKEPISAKEFKDIMEDKDFEIVDATSQFEVYEYLEKAYVALEKDYDYQIEFFKLDEEDDAIHMYNINKDKFEKQKSSASAEKSVSMGNNSKYVLKTNDKYKVVSRIENTVIYADVNEKYEDEVKEILKEMGY